MFPADRSSTSTTSSSVSPSLHPSLRPPLRTHPAGGPARRCRSSRPAVDAVRPHCHGPEPEMASFPGLFKAVGPAEEESGDLDGSLQQMLKAIADERSRLNQRQEVSGLGE